MQVVVVVPRKHVLRLSSNSGMKASALIKEYFHSESVCNEQKSVLTIARL